MQKSGHFRSPAWPPGAGPDFVNGVIRAETTLSAESTLGVLHAIESELGRQRRRRWEARVIDLDLVDYGGLVMPDTSIHRKWRNLPPQDQAAVAPDHIVLPHPRMQDRAFVLIPLRRVDPDWVHPATGQALDTMIAALDPDDIAAVTPLD